MRTNAELSAVNLERPEIQNLIYCVRGTQVMIDSDLAKLYQVETKALNRAASRNQGRFPADFRFRLTRDEVDLLRCQLGTLAGQDGESAIGRTYLPYAYTEQGVAMLSGVLRSEVAVRASVNIMRAFVEMRRFVSNNALLLDKVRALELSQLEYQKTTDARLECVFRYMESDKRPDQKIFFDGQVYDAFSFLATLVGEARNSLTLIDNYVDTKTLNILAKKRPNTSVEIWTSPRAKLTSDDVDLFNKQYPSLTVKHSTAFHDRFLVLDGEEGYLIGASLKDAGKKCFALTRIEDRRIVKKIIARLTASAEKSS